MFRLWVVHCSRRPRAGLEAYREAHSLPVVLAISTACSSTARKPDSRRLRRKGDFMTTTLRPASWADKVLLQEEMRRLQLRGFSFRGDTEAERLGFDRWVLGVAVVEERERKAKKRKGATGEV